jgi:HEAT repeat protein
MSSASAFVVNNYMKINLHEFNEYLSAIAGSDTEARWKAACGLARYSDAEWEGTPDAVTDAVTALVSRGVYRAVPADPRFRAEAAKTLGNLGSRSTATVPELLRLLQEDTDDTVRAEAAKALGKIGEKANSASLALTAMLGNPGVSDKTRGEAARALARVAPQDAGTVVALRSALGDLSSRVVISSAEALWSVCRDAGAVPALSARLGDPGTRDLAVQVLYRIGPGARTAVPALLVAAKDEDRLFRELVILALQKIDPGAAAKAGFRQGGA